MPEVIGVFFLTLAAAVLLLLTAPLQFPFYYFTPWGAGFVWALTAAWFAAWAW